jgi:quercetin dioxygenase-like cupin family protein
VTLTMADKPTNNSTQAEWPATIRAEFDREAQNPNPCVGQKLLSENEKVRVWRIHLRPGERCGFHRHVLDYFWSATTSGRGRQHFNDGTTREYTYSAGETRHENYGPGEFKVHDLENIGDTDLTFVTVEFLDSANAPMALPAGVRARAAA